MHWNQSTQACVAVARVKFLQESGKWAWPGYRTIQVGLRNDWISSKSLNIPGGLMISNHCSKHFQCHAFIPSFFDAVRRMVMQCANQHKTIYGYHTDQTANQHSRKHDLWEHHHHQFVQELFTFLGCGTIWAHKRKQKFIQQGPSPLSGQHMCPLLLTGTFPRT